MYPSIIEESSHLIEYKFISLIAEALQDRLFPPEERGTLSHRLVDAAGVIGEIAPFGTVVAWAPLLPQCHAPCSVTVELLVEPCDNEGTHFEKVLKQGVSTRA